MIHFHGLNAIHFTTIRLFSLLNQSIQFGLS